MPDEELQPGHLRRRAAGARNAHRSQPTPEGELLLPDPSTVCVDFGTDAEGHEFGRAVVPANGALSGGQPAEFRKRFAVTAGCASWLAIAPGHVDDPPAVAGLQELEEINVELVAGEPVISLGTSGAAYAVMTERAVDHSRLIAGLADALRF